MANSPPTFTFKTGKVTTDIGSNSIDVGDSVALQSDGRILVTGWTDNLKSVVVRYFADGTLDTSFDTNGKATVDLGTSARSVAVQSDGKILVAAVGGSSALYRLNSDGGLDISFKGAFTTIGNSGQLKAFSGFDVALQTDGKSIVAGTGNPTGLAPGIFLERYNPDGSNDSTFFAARVGTQYSFAPSLALQSDGKVLVHGHGSSSGSGASGGFVARLNSDGATDANFGANGQVFFDGADSNSIALQSDGKIVVAGVSNNDFSLKRLNTNGSLDTSFNGTGTITTDFNNSIDQGYRVAIQSDGKIVLSGVSNNDFALARYNTNGTLDTTFGSGGKVTTPINGPGNIGIDQAYSLKIQPDGKLLLAGTSDNDFALVRYNTDGSVDTSFGAVHNTLDSIPSFVENSAPVVLAPHVQIFDTELSAANSYNGASVTLARHGGANGQDVFAVASGGSLTPLVASSYFAVDGITIGRVATNDAGTLTLNFSAGATESLVDRAIEQISYTNTSDAPPASVQISWTFSDGSSGTDGALAAVGSTTVRITPTNDRPVLMHPLVNQIVVPGGPFSYNISENSFSDPDGDVLTYRAVLGDGTAFPPWLKFDLISRTFSGTPSGTDIHDYDIWLIATDPSGATAGDHFTLSVRTQLSGTSGNDVLTGGLGPESISGGDGSDWLYGGGGSDMLSGDGGNDYLYGQAGDDVLAGGDGADILSGGDGNDTLYGEWGDDGMYGDAGNDVMNGNAGGDFMAGGDGNDIMHGDDGQDWIYGEWGDDTLYGDVGNDFLFGNFGNDTLIGGPGNDTFYGGEGGDTFMFATNEGEDFIVDFSVAQGDKISIASGINGITTPAQALAHVRDSGANAVLDLGAGNYVMLLGVATSSLHASDFVIESATTGTTPTYNLTGPSTSVNEGSVASFILSTTNVAAGTSIGYTISGVNAADITGGLLSGSVVLDSTGKATIAVSIIADVLTEGTETLIVAGQGFSASTMVLDTSITLVGVPDGGGGGGGGGVAPVNSRHTSTAPAPSHVLTWRCSSTARRTRRRPSGP